MATIAVEAKKADVVPVAMVAMEPMAAPFAAHAGHAATVTDVTSLESEGANVTSAVTATDMTSAGATTTEAACHRRDRRPAQADSSAPDRRKVILRGHKLHKKVATARLPEIGKTGIAPRSGSVGRAAARSLIGLSTGFQLVVGAEAEALLSSRTCRCKHRGGRNL